MRNWLQKIALPTYYHGTDSGPFDEFDPSKAEKEKTHYNPLGQGMYVTDKQEFAAMFGKNVYEVDIPDNCKIKRLSPKQAVSAIGDIIKRALKKIGVKYWDTDLRFKIELGRQLDKAVYSPYESIMEAATLVVLTYPDKADEFYAWVGKIATQKFSKFDMVVFKGTNNPNDIFIGECPTKEIIIFNPEFQKIFDGNLRQ